MTDSEADWSTIAEILCLGVIPAVVVLTFGVVGALAIWKLSQLAVRIVRGYLPRDRS